MEWLNGLVVALTAGSTALGGVQPPSPSPPPTEEPAPPPSPPPGAVVAAPDEPPPVAEDPPPVAEDPSPAPTEQEPPAIPTVELSPTPVAPRSTSSPAIPTLEAPPPLDPEAGKCAAAAGQSSVFVVEWEPEHRQRLADALDRGVVAVHYEGCTIGLVANCQASVPYQFVGLEPRRETVAIPDVFELHAQLPRGASELEASLVGSGGLALDVMTVGRREVAPSLLGTSPVQGSGCSAATHVVTAVTVGAYRLRTEPPPGQQLQVIGAEGDAVACRQAMAGASAPPPACRAPLRIELTPVGEVERTNEVVEARKSLFARGTPWRKPAVIGTVSFGASLAGMAMLATGLNMTQDAEDRFTGEVIDPGKRASGVAVSVVGGILFYGGIAAGITFLSIAGVRRKKARRAAGVALGPAGLSLRF